MVSFDRPVRIDNGNDFSALTRARQHIITNVDKQEENQDYKAIIEIVSKLITSGTTKMGEGYCISVSDILYNILRQNGIKCHLLEVQLSAVDHKTGTSYMVGFNNAFQKESADKINTHVVVVTETKVPYLIDLSIAHRLPDLMQAVVIKAEGEKDKVIAEAKHKDFGLIYQQKVGFTETIPFPHLHQISILERIATDKQLFDDMKVIKKLNYLGIGLSLFAVINVIANWINIY